MKRSFYLEIFFIFLTFYGFIYSFQKAIIGNFYYGFSFLAFLVLCELFFRKYLLEFSIPTKTLYLARYIYWTFSPLKAKEEFFSFFVVHCLKGDYPYFISDLKEKHKVSSGEISEGIANYFHNRFEELHPRWLELSFIAFLNYREVENVSIYKIERLEPTLIKTFKENLDNIDLVLHNYCFYKFIKTKP